jgi:hypothetical protein
MGNSAARDTRRLDAAEKARKAAELRKNGASLQDIVDTGLYASRGSARRALQDRMTKLPAMALDELRATLDAKYGRAEANAMQLLEHADPSVKLRAAEVVAKIVAKRVDLFGVRAPAQVEVSVGPKPDEGETDLSKLSTAELVILKYLQSVVTSDERPPFAEIRETVRAWLDAHAPPAIALLPPVPATASLSGIRPSVNERTTGANPCSMTSLA